MRQAEPRGMGSILVNRLKREALKPADREAPTPPQPTCGAGYLTVNRGLKPEGLKPSDREATYPLTNPRKRVASQGYQSIRLPRAINYPIYHEPRIRRLPHSFRNQK